jgi:flagellar brake protein
MDQLVSKATTPPPAANDAAVRAPELVARTRQEMLRLLDAMLKRETVFTVSFPEAKAALQTSLVYVDASSHMLLMACPPRWAEALQAGKDSVRLSCVFEDARIEFPGGPCVLVDLDDAPVVGLPIPDFMWAFQRRRDPRQKVSGLVIVLNLGFLEAEAEVVDLSTGGVGLIHCNRDIKLDDGEVLNNCSITLPGVGRIPLNLVVQHQREVVLADGSEVTRAGCRFSGLTDHSRQLIAHYIEALANQ